MPRRGSASLSSAGIRLLERARTPEEVEAALEAIPDGDPGLRPAILRRYQAIAGQSPQRDHGTAIRTVLVKALRSCAHQDDVPLLSAALWTYEFGPSLGGGPDEVAGGLRGAALIVLNDVEPGLAAFHAARLLTDPYTSRFSGEPALTAVRVLGQQDQVLPLYAFAVQGGGAGEAMAECFRALAAAPAVVVRRLIERSLPSTDEIALVGLIDLLVGHPDRAAFTPLLLQYLRDTTMLDLYRYAVTAIVAARRPDLIDELRRMATAERRAEQAAILREALSLAP